LSTQQLTTQLNEAARAFGRLMRANQVLRRELDAHLAEDHQLTVSEFEVLILLAKAKDRAMRRVDLANEVRLSPSGITRMLDRLEASGLVEKRACDEDARVSYAALTDQGMTEIQSAMPVHYDGLEVLMHARLSEDEVKQLSDLLERLAGGIDDEPCEVPED
jgi:DNA-binding MarR family transcriptional regulator